MTTTNTIDTTLTENVFQLFSQVNNLKQEKKEKTAPLYAEIATIEKQFNSQVYSLEQELNDIKEQYSSFAHDLAINSGQCPCSRWGGHLAPSEVDMDEKGINLTWIQENNYGRDDYDYFSATWEQLLAYEKTQIPLEIIEIEV